jgi:hypothetical protein
MLTILGMALCPVAALAQQPFVVDDTDVTVRGAWHLELNTEFARLRTLALPVEWQALTDVELGRGLGRGFELSVAVPLVTLATDRAISSGLGDVDVALKVRLPSGQDARHTFAVNAALELPTGSHARGFGSSLTDVDAALAWQWQVSPAVTLRANGGAVVAGNTESGALGIERRGTIFTGGTSLTLRLSARMLVGAELTGARSQHDAIGASYVQWQVGGNIALDARSTLDWGIIRGQTASSPRGGFQVGYSRGFGP